MALCFFENGVPYMIFCHEWVQVSDGEMCIVRLSDDLKRTVGEPKLLFKASDPIWVPSKKPADLSPTDRSFINAPTGDLL